MNHNPYKYTGPLDPKEDALVCVPRTKEVNKVITGIMRGDYWAILGPSQIGKNTFLRLIRKEFPYAYYLMVDFEVLQADNEKAFYQWLTAQFKKEIPHDSLETADDENKDYSSALQFFNFLESFKPKKNIKIVLLFDEIDDLPFVRNFLHVWRKVFHKRYYKERLKQYAVVITGSVELVALTSGPNSPFNIAKKIHLKDFSIIESKKLIEAPLQNLNIEIEEKAKEKLIFQISGHPQMLQYACHELVEKTENKKMITEKNVDEAIEILLANNPNLVALRQEVKLNNILEDLVKSLLVGEKRRFHPYNEYASLGSGPIIEDENHFCKIRNEVYKKSLMDIFDISSILSNNSEVIQKTAQVVPIQEKPKIFICYSHEDKEWKKILLGHLSVLEFEGILYVWEDHQIEPGQKWDDEIEAKMRGANLALFLISRHSLTSEYIKKRELPILLKRKEEEGMNIFPVIVRPCAWKRLPWLSEMEVRPKDEIPISQGDSYDHEARGAEIADEIFKIFEREIHDE